MNIQNDHGKAKPYQVRQVLWAIDLMEQIGKGNMSVDHYTYRVTWSPEDGEHVGLCAELACLQAGGCAAGIRKVVAAAVADMKRNREDIPAPLAEKVYSGQFKVRIPPQVHRALALQAAEEGVSLNRLASAKLSATH